MGSLGDKLRDKQKGAAKTARIPIKVVPATPLKKPEWIRVKGPGPGSRFHSLQSLIERQ